MRGNCRFGRSRKFQAKLLVLWVFWPRPSIISALIVPISRRRAMIAMPEPDRAVLGRRAEIVQALRRLVPGEGVIDHENELRAFESDGLTAYRQPPMVAVLPQTTAQVVEVMRYCLANKIKVVPRGAGTSLSGGALPLADGVLLVMGKFNKKIGR